MTSMEDLFSISLHSDDGVLAIRATWGDRQESDSSCSERTPAYLAAKDELKDRTPGYSIREVQHHQQICIALGTELFETVFVGRVLALFREYRRQNELPRIALHLDRSLYREPWELLRDPHDAMAGEFLSIVGSITRFDAEAPTPPEATFFATTHGLRCLYVSPQPSPTPNREAVPPFEPDSSDSSGDIAYDVIAPPTFAGLSDIADRASTRPDAFLFYGHGDVRDKTGHLVFVTRKGLIPGWKSWDADLRSGHSLSSVLAEKRQLRLGCLMACESAWMGDDHVDISFCDTVVGALLSQTRAGFVIGAQLKLNFTAAAHFMSAVVAALSNRLPLDLAVRSGRKAIKTLSQASEGVQAPLDWWVPVLYAKSTMFELIAPNPRVPLPRLTGTF